MAVFRAWQAVFSVLAIGCFFALEYMRDTSAASVAFVACSWVCIIATWLLAVVWVVKKLYIRTLALAVVVAAVRLSLDDTLSDFMKLAAWFLLGAIVLTVVVALAVRMRRKRNARPVSPPAQFQSEAPKAPAAEYAAQEAAPPLSSEQAAEAIASEPEAGDDKGQDPVAGGQQ